MSRLQPSVPCRPDPHLHSLNQVKQIVTCCFSVNSFKTPAVREEELSHESSAFLFELIDGHPTFSDIRKRGLCMASVDSIRNLHDDGFCHANLIFGLFQPSFDISMNLRSQCREAVRNTPIALSWRACATLLLSSLCLDMIDRNPCTWRNSS